MYSAEREMKSRCTQRWWHHCLLTALLTIRLVHTLHLEVPLWLISKHWLQYYSKGKAMVVCFTTAVQLSFYSILRFSDWVSFQLLEFSKILRLPMLFWAWMVQTASQKFRTGSWSVMSHLSARDILVHTLYSSCSALHACYSLQLQQLILVKKILLNAELISGFWPHRNFVSSFMMFPLCQKISISKKNTWT
jgi:hypothetical protein